MAFGVLVSQFEYVESTAEAHVRYRQFVALREDKKSTDIQRE